MAQIKRLRIDDEWSDKRRTLEHNKWKFDRKHSEKRSDDRIDPKKRHFKRLRGHVSLEQIFIESDAFYDLSGMAAMRTLLRFHQKANKRFTGGRKRGGSKSLETTNNGEITFPYTEFVEDLGYNRGTFAKCLKELIDEKGFIDIAERGNWHDGKLTKYSISYRWMDYGTDQYRKPSKSWKLQP